MIDYDIRLNAALNRLRLAQYYYEQERNEVTRMELLNSEKFLCDIREEGLKIAVQEARADHLRRVSWQ